MYSDFNKKRYKIVKLLIPKKNLAPTRKTLHGISNWFNVLVNYILNKIHSASCLLGMRPSKFASKWINSHNICQIDMF